MKKEEWKCIVQEKKLQPIWKECTYTTELLVVDLLIYWRTTKDLHPCHQEDLLICATLNIYIYIYFRDAGGEELFVSGLATFDQHRGPSL